MNRAVTVRVKRSKIWFKVVLLVIYISDVFTGLKIINTSTHKKLTHNIRTGLLVLEESRGGQKGTMKEPFALVFCSHGHHLLYEVILLSSLILSHYTIVVLVFILSIALMSHLI